MLGEIGKIINFCWTPSHIGIHGNNEADEAAKSAVVHHSQIDNLVERQTFSCEFLLTKQRCIYGFGNRHSLSLSFMSLGEGWGPPLITANIGGNNSVECNSGELLLCMSMTI